MSLLTQAIQEYLSEGYEEWVAVSYNDYPGHIDIHMMHRAHIPYITIDECSNTISLRSSVISSDRTILLQHTYSGETILQNITNMIECVKTGKYKYV